MEKKVKIAFALTALLFQFNFGCGTATAQKSVFHPYYFSADLYYYPEEVPGKTVESYVSFDDVSPSVRFAGTRELTSETLESIRKNRNTEAIPASVRPAFGYARYGVNMKMMPTSLNLHKGNPLFDSNQYTRIGASSPVAVLHKSEDGEFSYVQAKSMRGWVPSDSIEIWDEYLFKAVLRLPYATVLRDGVIVGGVAYRAADRIPVTAYDPSTGEFSLLLPNGKKARAFVSDGLAPGSLEYDERTMKKAAESFLGNRYDWGGKSGYRDCSSYVGDLWKIFGADLPRNTGMQARVGKKILGKPASKEEFYNTLAKCEPFRTLIFFNGHVLMYGGRDENDFIVYHAVNRLQKDDGETVNLAAVTKNFLFKENFSDIWKRVVAVTEL